MKFKIGDRVEVIKRLYGHRFEIGEVVIIKRCGGNYDCSNGIKSWVLICSEFILSKEYIFDQFMKKELSGNNDV